MKEVPEIIRRKMLQLKALCEEHGVSVGIVSMLTDDENRPEDFSWAMYRKSIGFEVWAAAMMLRTLTDIGGDQLAEAIGKLQLVTERVVAEDEEDTCYESGFPNWES